MVSVCLPSDALLQRLLSYLGFSYLGRGVLEVVKQEIARVNVDILGISELKWTGMGEFNSDDHYIYYCGQESFRSTKESKMQYLDEISKMTE